MKFFLEVNNEDSDMDIEAQEILESFVPEVNINDECSVCPYDNCGKYFQAHQFLHKHMIKFHREYLNTPAYDQYMR